MINRSIWVCCVMLFVGERNRCHVSICSSILITRRVMRVLWTEEFVLRSYMSRGLRDDFGAHGNNLGNDVINA